MSSPTLLPMQQQLDTLTTAGWHLRGEDSMALVSLSILLYDHILTFGEEVEYIWKRKISLISSLYIFNRYFAPPAFAVCMVALFSPNWTIDSCRRFAKFEGILTLITVMIAETMLILRVYAVHQKSKKVLALLVFMIVTQLGFMSFTLANSGPVIIPPSKITYGCVLVANPNIGGLDIFFVAPSMVFDTTVIILLLASLRGRTEGLHKSAIFKLILRDGLSYFLVVFVINTSWTITGLTLVSDLKNILSFFSTAITNILIGRLTLNLKKYEAPVLQGSFMYLLPTSRRAKFSVTGEPTTHVSSNDIIPMFELGKKGGQ